MLPRPNVRQRIVNWLLANDDVKLPGGVEFGENSVTIGSTDVKFDADGGLAQQDGTQVASLPNDGSVAIDALDINNEMLAEAEKTSTQSYATADGFVTVTWDNEVSDVTTDFDLANDQFTPPEAGTYHIEARIRLSSYADQDRLKLKLQDIGTGSAVMVNEVGASGTNLQSIGVSGERQLNANKHEIQFQGSSDDTIRGGGSECYLTISRSEEN